MLSPVVAALFFILSILWPHTIFTCIAGVSMGVVLIRLPIPAMMGSRDAPFRNAWPWRVASC